MFSSYVRNARLPTRVAITWSICALQGTLFSWRRMLLPSRVADAWSIWQPICYLPVASVHDFVGTYDDSGH